VVIFLEIVKFTIKRVLIDQGSSFDDLYWTVVEKLGLPDSLPRSYAGSFVGFSREHVNV
jgi:hypothetical protein